MNAYLQTLAATGILMVWYSGVFWFMQTERRLLPENKYIDKAVVIMATILFGGFDFKS